MIDLIAIRFGEVFLKGDNRRFFENKLRDQVARVLAAIPDARVERVHARLFVEVPSPDLARALDALAHVFGIESFSPAKSVARDVDAIAVQAIAQTQDALAQNPELASFKIETRRSDKSFRLTSLEVSRDVGARVLFATGLRVDVHEPALRVGVEIGPERSFVFTQTIRGPGGLPVGSAGRVNLLLSGGIDSPVAGWLAMKRGCNVDATYFHSFPYTGDKTKQKVVDLARILVPWHGPIRLSVVPFTDVQKALRAAGPPRLAVLLYRRMMVRVASLLAERAGAKALVTGDNLGQVASQTLENLAVVEDAASVPILRPLVTYDKAETVALAKRIGTFATSILPYEDCCALFVPEHPATRARPADALDAESTLDVEALARELADHVDVIDVS